MDIANASAFKVVVMGKQRILVPISIAILCTVCLSPHLYLNSTFSVSPNRVRVLSGSNIHKHTPERFNDQTVGLESRRPRFKPPVSNGSSLSEFGPD